MNHRIAVVSAGLSDPSSTRLLADRLTAATVAAIPGAVVDVIELRPLAHDLTNRMLTGFAAAPLTRAQATLASADGVVAVTPVFSASYSGLFKSFFDVLEPGLLAGKPVLIAATAGTARHSLVLDHAMRPLFGWLRALVVPTAVFAASEDWGDVTQGALSERIGRAGRELADLVNALPPAEVADPFADVPDFETLVLG